MIKINFSAKPILLFEKNTHRVGKSLISLLFTLLFFSSCNFSETIVSEAPKIVLDSESGIYTTKQGKCIVISPKYENAENARFSWSINDSIVSTQSDYEFCSDKLGETYIVIKVETESGSDQEEIRIDVVELEIPRVSLIGANNGFVLSLGEDTTFHASVVKTSLPTTYTWILNDSQVSDSLAYTFHADSIGSYKLSFIAQNEDGTDSIFTTISVVDLPPISWSFAQTDYQLIAGRTIEIGPTETTNLEGATYRFSLGDSIIQQGEKSTWLCDWTTEGEYSIDILATLLRNNQTDSLHQTITLKVISSETLYYRPKTQESSANFNRVYEYTPAPGQFINELKTGGFDGSQTTPEAAIVYAEQRLNNDNWVSLGAFGGYIVVGFDHSIDNTGYYDFAIVGNSFSGSSEPGIVWVMQDENGDGLPNDNWYELRGSETGKDSTIQNYAVTYYRPSAPQMPIQWTDNLGNSGEIDYLKQFHNQDYYYPAWVEADSYTLRGTRLASNNYDKSGNGSHWVQVEYDWGYADNFSPSDRLEENGKTNHFKISDAIDSKGNTINLKYIDFIKVQTAINAKSGWLGENSTEVVGFYDYNMNK